LVITCVNCFSPGATFARSVRPNSSRLLDAATPAMEAVTPPPAVEAVTPPPAAVEAVTKNIVLNPRNFLQKILSSRSSVQEKKVILENLQNLRMVGVKESNAPGTFNYAEFIDELLVLIDSVEGNRWAAKRLPIPLPSLRMKLGSARRLLVTLIESDEKMTLEKGMSNVDSAKRRRALGILLNQLRETKGVRSLELEATKRISRNTMAEMLERTPKGLETPKYSVVYDKPTFQIRKYESFAVCSMMLVDQKAQQGPAGFQTLAGYIFGKNVESEKMAMTTPVISSGMINAAEGGALQPKKMSFVMPSSFWEAEALSKAPTPVDGSVNLESKGGGLIANTDDVAVLWFGGYATKGEIDIRASELLNCITLDGTYKIKDAEVPYLMQYNDPFVPPWARRNEVAIPVVKTVPDMVPV